MDIPCLSSALNRLNSYDLIREGRREDCLRKMLMEAAWMEYEARRQGNQMQVALRCMLSFETGLIYPSMLQLAENISKTRIHLQSVYDNCKNRYLRICLKELRQRHLKVSLNYTKQAFRRSSEKNKRSFKPKRGIRVKVINCI